MQTSSGAANRAETEGLWWGKGGVTPTRLRMVKAFTGQSTEAPALGLEINTQLNSKAVLYFLGEDLTGRTKASKGSTSFF